MAEMINLTSADFTARMATVSTFPAGFELENFADGDAISIAGVQAADMVPGVDGGTGYWYIPNIKEVTINLMPGSTSENNLSLLAANMEMQKAPDLIQLVITIPSMGCTITFIDGVITSYPPIPGISQRLQNAPYSMKFRTAQRMPL
nr:MAG TPA: Protein of unknown function (DUF3277) [Caudoviricetes sp.]